MAFPSEDVEPKISSFGSGDKRVILYQKRDGPWESKTAGSTMPKYLSVLICLAVVVLIGMTLVGVKRLCLRQLSQAETGNCGKPATTESICSQCLGGDLFPNWEGEESSHLKFSAKLQKPLLSSFTWR